MRALHVFRIAACQHLLAISISRTPADTPRYDATPQATLVPEVTRQQQSPAVQPRRKLQQRRMCASGDAPLSQPAPLRRPVRPSPGPQLRLQPLLARHRAGRRPARWHALRSPQRVPLLWSSAAGRSPLKQSQRMPRWPAKKRKNLQQLRHRRRGPTRTGCGQARRFCRASLRTPTRRTRARLPPTSTPQAQRRWRWPPPLQPGLRCGRLQRCPSPQSPKHASWRSQMRSAEHTARCVHFTLSGCVYCVCSFAFALHLHSRCCTLTGAAEGGCAQLWLRASAAR